MSSSFPLSLQSWVAIEHSCGLLFPTLIHYSYVFKKLSSDHIVYVRAYGSRDAYFVREEEKINHETLNAYII